MLAEKILNALNEQLKQEERNSRAYYQMAAWCDKSGFIGVGKWFYDSAKDERMHVRMIANYITERNCKFELSALDKPQCEFAGILELFTITQKLEEITTKNIQELYRLSMTEGDFLTSEFLLPMLKEQVEEERKVQDALDFIKLAGTAPPGLALIDNKLGK